MSTHTLPEPTFARTRLGSGPGLLLAPGAGSSLANTYGPIMAGLAAGHTVVGIDYPGGGDTPRATTPLSVDDLADQLVAAADAEGLDRFALSGYSLGAAVAVRAAARHPERVTALVLTAGFAYRDNRLALTCSVWSRIAASGDRDLLGEFPLTLALGTQALESMPAERLRQSVGFAAGTAADGTPEHATSPAGSTSGTTSPASPRQPWSSRPPTTGWSPPPCKPSSPRPSPAPTSRRSPPGTYRCWSEATNGFS